VGVRASEGWRNLSLSPRKSRMRLSGASQGADWHGHDLWHLPVGNRSGHSPTI